MRKTISIITILVGLTTKLYAAPTDSLLMEKYGMVKIHSSSIGIYYARPQDKAAIVQLDSFLTIMSTGIFEEFEHKIEGQVQFEFYPSINASQCVCGWDTLNKKERNWTKLGCAHYIKKIQMVMPGTSIEGDSIYKVWGGFNKVMLHEYIHNITYDIIGEANINKIPWWITEGLACWKADQYYYGKGFKKLILEKIDQGKVPTVKDLHTNYLKVELLYGWSWLFCDYIISTYGWDTMLQIQSDFKHFKKILGKSYNQINMEWLEYLKNKPVDI